MIVYIEVKDPCITKLTCPKCKAKSKDVALKKDSKIVGLVLKCHRCGSKFEIKTE